MRIPQPTPLNVVEVLAAAAAAEARPNPNQEEAMASGPLFDGGGGVGGGLGGGRAVLVLVGTRRHSTLRQGTQAGDIERPSRLLR